MALTRGGAKVTIYDSVIRGHFREAGLVKVEADRMASLGSTFVKARAPKRTGKLASSVGSASRGAPGRYGASFTVYADAGYALFVEEGTANDGAGFIYPTKGSWLRLPRSSFGSVSFVRLLDRGEKRASSRAFIFQRAVHGQRAQHFIKRGVRDALRSRGYGTFF